MSFPKLSRLSFKLPAMVAGAIITIAVGLGTINYLSGRSATLADAHDKLEVVSHSRVESLQVYFERLEITMKTAVASPLTVSATETFLLNYTRLDDAARNDIRLAYTDLNPFPAGERQNLDAAEGFSFYHVAHEGTHPAFREFNTLNQLYDTFIVSMEGDIIYSVFKENDFGQNILTGELSSSGIGEAFSLSLQAAPGEVAFSHFAPYAPSAGQMAGFASAPVYDADGAQIGVLIAQMNIHELTEVINDPIGLDETGKVFLINNEGQVVTESRFEGGPAALDTVPFTDHIVAALRGEDVRVHNVQGLYHSSVSAVAQLIELGGLQYAIIVEKSMDETLEPVVRQRNMAAIVTVIGASIMSLIAWLFIRSVTGSIERIQSQMIAISDGNYATEVTSVRRTDEIGDIGRSLVDFKTKLEMAQAQTVEREREQEDQNDVLTALRKGLIELAEGDLTHPIEQEFTPQYESLRADFNETLRTLSDAISNVIRVTGSITHGAGEISQASDDLSNRTENQAATLEQTAAALDELTASVKSAADGAKSVEAIVVEAQSEAEESGVIVGNAIAAMTEIEKSSEHINQIIGVIDDIAFQTNLLALNAGVEAARAGDAGKGFAVVASEVRALAQRSSDAAKEIKALISDSSKQVERGVDLVGGAGKALDSIVQRVTHISELIRNIANGSSEQAIGLGEINIGVNQLDQVTQQNAAMVEEATAASHVLKGDASQLQDLVTRFKTLEAKVHNTQFVHSNAANDAPSFQSDYATDADDDVIEVEFTRTRDTQANPDPVPIAVGDVPASSNKGPQADEWQEF